MIKKQDIVFAIINSLTTLILFFISQSFYLNGLEDYKIFYLGPWFSTFIEEKYNQNTDRFVFVDTNFDNSIIEGNINGNSIITDREKLEQLFSKLKVGNEHQYVICDILFDSESKYDEELLEAMSNTKNLIIPRKDSLVLTNLKFRHLTSGLVDLSLPDNNFYKFKLSDKNVKSLPLKMFEDVQSTEINFNFPFYFSNKGLVFNDFVPLLKITERDIKKRGGHYFPLNHLLLRKPEKFKKITKDKIIIIGNYETDMHNTLQGKVAGPLILLNVFVSLENSLNIFSYPLLLTLFLIFFFFSIAVQYSRTEFDLILSRIPFLGGLSRGITYGGVMIILSVIIFFIFGNSINLLLVAAWFLFQNKVRNTIPYWRNVCFRLNRVLQEIQKQLKRT